MYAKDDPRALLNANSGGAVPKAGEGFAGTQYGRFYETAPQVTSPHGDTWYTRGENLVVGYSNAKPGLVLDRKGQVDEYVVLIPNDDVKATITWKDERQDVEGPVAVFIPKGDSKVEITAGG